MMTTTKELAEALRLLGAYTSGRFDMWALAGNSKASCRAHVMSALLGKKTPQSKSGVNAMREEFFRQMDIMGDCLAAREENFVNHARALLAE